MNKDYVTIGQIVKSLEGDAKISRQGLYYYEELGLIAPAIKTERLNLYTKDTIDKIKKIRELSKSYKLEAIVKMVKEGKL